LSSPTTVTTLRGGFKGFDRAPVVGDGLMVDARPELEAPAGKADAAGSANAKTARDSKRRTSCPSSWLKCDQPLHAASVGREKIRAEDK
jgi:hypothetical protein